MQQLKFKFKCVSNASVNPAENVVAALVTRLTGGVTQPYLIQYA